MSIAIRILSGARKGEEIQLETDVFRVGDTPGCEVYFDPRLDSAARGRSATVRLGEDGWTIRPSEPGRLMLNHALVTAESRIRSGDVLRMSEAGPDFLFTITGRRAEISAAGASTRSSAPLDAQQAMPVRESPPKETSPSAAAPNAVRHNWKWAMWTAAGLAAALFAVSAWRMGVQRSATGTNIGPPKAPIKVEAISERTIEEDMPPALEPIQNTTGKAGEQPTLDAVAADADLPAVEGDPWARVQAELRESLLLVQVEADGPSGSYSWPFATCSAIDPHTMLTSAREVLQLAQWQRQGYRIWATCPSTGLKVPVKDFRVHREFAQLAEKPGDWIFADLGLLITEGELPRPVRLASPEDLRRLEVGLPIACFGFPHEGNKITRFDTFRPQLHRGQVYLISSRGGVSGSPELLELKAKIPENVFGSPIVNDQGQLIGVYGEAAGAGDMAVKDLHYAPVVDTALLKAWTERAETVWVSPPPSTKY